MFNQKIILVSFTVLLFSVSNCLGGNLSLESTDATKKDNLLLFNIESASVIGSYWDDIDYLDNSAFAKLIYGGSISYDKIISRSYSIGGSVGYLLNKIDRAKTHAYTFSANYSYYLRGFNRSSSYMKVELGFIKASSEDVYVNTSHDDLSTDFIPYYKLGLGTNGLQGNRRALRFEIFYKTILSDNKEIKELDSFKIDGNLSTIGILIGYGLSW